VLGALVLMGVGFVVTALLMVERRRGSAGQRAAARAARGRL